MKRSNQKLLSALGAAAVLLGWQGTAFADPSLQEQLAAMKQQIQLLEQKIEAQQKEMAQSNTTSGSNGWFNKVSVSGAVEVEASYSEDYNNVDSGDINVATAELGIEAAINNYASASVVLLWEEEDGGDDNLKVDEALVTLTPESTGPVSFALGRTAVPFGVFDTNMVSDPLTLELGETKETIAMASFESNGLYGNAYVFNGDLDKTGNDNAINNIGANFGYAWEQGDQAFDISLGYINDMGDSDTLSDTVSGNSATYARNVPGLALSAKYTVGPFNVIGEYVGATKDFAAGELAFNGIGARPSAWNLEAGYTFGNDTTVALGYQKTKEALGLEYPETRLSAAVSFPVMKNTALSFEWAHDSDYDAADGGTGENADSVTAQLAVEF